MHKLYSRDPKYCVAAFNSRGEKTGFEWTKVLGESGYSSLHFAPEQRSWYHFCIPEVLDLLDKYKPNVLIGSSMGGYAALLFSGLTGIRATVFGPQVTLEDVPWDRRWQHEWEPIRQKTQYPELLDLSKLNHNPDTHIYYCQGSTEDKLHAKLLKGRVRITIRGCLNHEEASRNLHRGVFD